jgi:sigma-E processing peptidase SpoIIGA
MYVDVLLIENFIIDYLLLNVTSKLSKLKTNRTRLSIGAAVGALYILIVFFPSLKVFLGIVTNFAVSALMLIIAFAPEKFKDFFKVLGLFYVIAFVFGGAAFFLFYFTGKGNVVNGVYYIKNFPFSMLIAGLTAGYFLVVYCYKYVQHKALNDELNYNITVIVDNKQARIKAILDTGNSLKDPISNLPVIVAEYDALHDILPEELIYAFDGNEGNLDFTSLHKLIDNGNLALRLRLIPFSSLGKQNGMLIGIKPDMVIVTSKKYNLEISKVIVGIYNNKISKDGEYGALLYPEILK